MKLLIRKGHMLTAILFPTLVVACMQASPVSREPVSREQVVKNLSPIVDMEKRSTQLTIVMQQLPFVTKISPEDARALKEHYDVYYVYHNAAATSLAEGNFQAYRDQVRVGSKELDSLEAKLKDVLKKSSGHGQENQSAPGESSGSL